jgi:hypothetical protein
MRKEPEWAEPEWAEPVSVELEWEEPVSVELEWEEPEWAEPEVAVSLLKPPHGGLRRETAVTRPFRK